MPLLSLNAALCICHCVVYCAGTSCAFVDNGTDILADIFLVEILVDCFFSAVGAWVTQDHAVPLYDWCTKWFGYGHFLVLREDELCLSDVGCSVGVFEHLNKFWVAKLEL